MFEGASVFVMDLLWWTTSVIAVLLILGVASIPFVLKFVFPIRFVVYKNAGGAKGNDSIVLYKNVTRRGRIINTQYGKRVKILGIKATLPMSLCSRENALNWEAGGVAFIIYEKEIGQFFPVDPHLRNLELLETKNKEASEKLKKIHEYILERFPELAGYVSFVNPKRAKQIIPVTFANSHVKLQPIPTDMITQFTHDIVLMKDKYQRQTWMEKYGFYLISAAVVVLIITVAVLSFEQVNKSIDDRLAQLGAGTSGIANKIADKLSNAEVPPGGSSAFIPFIPLLFGRRFLKWE